MKSLRHFLRKFRATKTGDLGIQERFDGQHDGSARPGWSEDSKAATTDRSKNVPSDAIPPHVGPLIDRIGFLVHSAELLNHFGCVWELLPRGSFDVLLHGEAESLKKAEFSRWECRVGSTAENLDSRTRYRYLVSNHPISLGEWPLIKLLGSVNVRFMYAAGKSGWNLLGWNDLYDVILCFGPYHAAAFEKCSEAVVLQMGYPRFDRYFTTKPDIGELQERYGCSPSKKTVVWLPTWKTLSSVGFFDQEISALTETYNVVVKLHPLMPGSEPDRVTALKRHPFTRLIADSSDNLPLYQLADYMLFDYGGPPFGAIYTDKNMILLNVPNAENDELTGIGSPDIRIRQNLVNVNAGERAIARLLADDSIWQKQRHVRRAIRKVYFAPYFGFSSKVAASALLNLDSIVWR